MFGFIFVSLAAPVILTFAALVAAAVEAAFGKRLPFGPDDEPSFDSQLTATPCQSSVNAQAGDSTTFANGAPIDLVEEDLASPARETCQPTPDRPNESGIMRQRTYGVHSTQELTTMGQ